MKKTARLELRITQKLRKALEQKADELGISVSEVARLAIVKMAGGK